MSLHDVIQKARDTGDPSDLTNAVPYTRWLGISMALEDGAIRGELAFSSHLVGNPHVPALHGGTLGALLESTAIFELMWHGDVIVVPKTISITVEYLRSARLEDVHARAYVTKRGRRIANVRTVAWQEDPERPIAAAHGHWLLGDEPEDG